MQGLRLAKSMKEKIEMEDMTVLSSAKPDGIVPNLSYLVSHPTFKASYDEFQLRNHHPMGIIRP